MERSYHLIHKLLGMRRRCVLLQDNLLANAMQECSRILLLLWLLYILGGTSGTPPKNCSIRIRSILLEHSKSLWSSIEQVDQVNVYSIRGKPTTGCSSGFSALGTLVAEDNSKDDIWFRDSFSREAKRRDIYTYDAYASAVIAYLPLDRLELVRDRKLARTLILKYGAVSANIDAMNNRRTCTARATNLVIRT